MLNQIAFGVIAWLFNDFLRETGGTSLGAHTKVIPQSGWMPSIDPIIEFFGIDIPGGRSSIYGFVLIAIALGALYCVRSPAPGSATTSAPAG